MPNIVFRFPVAAIFLGLTFAAGPLASPALAASRAVGSDRSVVANAGPQVQAVAPLATPDMPPPPELPDVASYVVMDAATGTIIAEKAPTIPWAPASLAKLMTAYLIYQAVAHGPLTLDKTVPVSVAAWRAGGSRMFIAPGMSVTVGELLHGLIIDSGNDAAVALAQAAAGTRGTFIQWMNTTAAKLGLDGTHYSNVSGLPDPDLHTTARDTAILSRALIQQYPQILQISDKKYYTFDKIRQRNWNPVLFRDPTVDGLKTGLTDASGHCIDATAVRRGRRLIAVELGAPHWSSATTAVEALLDYGYRYYSDAPVTTANKQVGVLTDAMLTPETIPVAAAKDVVLTVAKQDRKSLKVTLKFNIDLPSSLLRGTQVGTITISMHGNTIATVPAVTLAGARRASYMTRLMRRLRKML